MQGGPITIGDRNSREIKRRIVGGEISNKWYNNKW